MLYQTTVNPASQGQVEGAARSMLLSDLEFFDIQVHWRLPKTIITLLLHCRTPLNQGKCISTRRHRSLFLDSPPSLYRFWHFASLFILMFSIKDRAFKLNRPHSRGKKVLLWKEILQDLQYPNATIVHDIILGFSLTGRAPKTGVFEPWCGSLIALWTNCCFFLLL